MQEMLGKYLSQKYIHRPVFVVGGSRSGTIVLLKALGMHREILSAPTEDPFIADVGNFMRDLEAFPDHKKSYYSRTLRIGPDYIRSVLQRLSLESAMGPDYGIRHLLGHAVNDKRYNIFRKHFWCTKTFPNKNVAGGLLKLYPDAKFIWILRNGVNVVHSRTRFPEFRDLPFDQQCQHWADTINSYGYLTKLPEAIVIHQEDLLNDPAKVFRRIFDHIGIEDDGKSTEYALTHHVHPLADSSTSTGVDIKKIISERPPAYQDWTDAQRMQFKDVCGAAMQRAGYEIDF